MHTGCMYTNPAGNAPGPVILAQCWPVMQRNACQGRGWESEFHPSCRRMCRWQFRNQGTTAFLTREAAQEALVGSQTVTVASNLAQSVSHLGVKPTRSKRKGHCSSCVSSYQTVFFPGMNGSVWKAERETKTCVLGKTRVTELSAASECFCYLIHPF